MEMMEVNALCSLTHLHHSPITSIISISIDTRGVVWYHLPCVTGDRGGYGRNALGEILMAGKRDD
jgi:hypothetical protein